MKPLSLIERLYKYCELHWNDGKSAIVKHFVDENTPKRTIYRYIEMWEKGLSPTRRLGSGRKPKIMTRANLNRLANMTDDRSGISTRQLARKFKCSQSYIVKTIQEKTAIKYHKKTKIPDRRPHQLSQLQTRCGRMCRKFHSHEFVLDDESYFTLSHSDKNSNAGFWSSDVSSAPNNVKFKVQAKFEKKVLVWMAISPRGISQPFIAPSGLAINQEIYLNECLAKRLLPFIEKHHADGNYVFWPDLASSHYATVVTDYLTAKKVVFVEKKDNPACVPELRPIEHFWSILKGLVYERNWRAETIDQLTNRIKYCLKKVDVNVVQGMVRGVYSRVDTVRREGEVALLRFKKKNLNDCT